MAQVKLDNARRHRNLWSRHLSRVGLSDRTEILECKQDLT